MNVRDPIYTNNPYIGRIDASSIPPPHIVTSLVEHICAKEGRGFGVNWDRDESYSAELFETIRSPKAFDLQEPISLLTTDRPGSRPQDPLILKVGYTGMLE